MQRFKDDMEENAAAVGRGWIHGFLLGGVLWILIFLFIKWMV